MRRFPTLCVTLALAAVAIGQADPSRPGDKAAAVKAPFVFEAGTVELRTLLQRCGTYLQRNILADDIELTGAYARKQPRPQQGVAVETPTPVVELQLPVVTDRDGCEELLSSLLWARGLVLVPLDEPKAVYEVLSLNGQRAREIPLRAVQRTPEQVLARPTLRQFVTVVYTMKHTNAQYASNALRPFFMSTSGNPGSTNQTLNLGSAGNSASLLLSGPQDLVANALLVLRAADVPQPPELRTEADVRVEALAKQQGELVRRIAAIEEKVGDKAGRPDR
ncbi:MAG: hypothetical protein WAT39_05535 [Planctomycetota bacterium]